MKRIYFRNFMATALLVLSCFLVIGLSFFFLGRSYLINNTRDMMSASADEVARSAAALSRAETLSSWNLRMTISPIANSTDTHIFISDPKGLVFSCSDLTLFCSQHQGKQLDPGVMNSLYFAGSMDQLTSLAGFYPEPRFVVAKPILAGNVILGYVFVSSDSSSILGAWRTFLVVVLTVLVAVMFIALLMSLVFSKRMSEPLDKLAVAARKFALGDFSVRVGNPDGRSDEIGTLIDSFNYMADSLEQSEKQREEFIANVSHELRTPMTTIAGFADGIIDGTIPREQEDKYLHKIADETRRLSRLVRNMLNVSQREHVSAEQLKRTKFDLSELLLQTLLSFEERARAKGLDVDPLFPQDPMIVLAERDSITQVLYNLLDNAIKFAAVDSVITLRLYKRGKKAFVSIKNTGETIPEDDLPYIFERFHKSDRSRSLDKDGVGLGLYLVKTIINSHGENIAVTSRDGVTEFVFTLPLV